MATLVAARAKMSIGKAAEMSKNNELTTIVILDLQPPSNKNRIVLKICRDLCTLIFNEGIPHRQHNCLETGSNRKIVNLYE